MQHFVALVAGLHQTFRCVPHLRRLVGQELVGDDLVHREVELRAHHSAVMVDLVSSGLDGGTQFGVLGQDQDRAVVLVVGIEEAELYTVELAAEGWHGEDTPLVMAHTANASERHSNASRSTAPTSWQASGSPPDTAKNLLVTRQPAPYLGNRSGLYSAFEGCGPVEGRQFSSAVDRVQRSA